jgi:hypothetical protein
MNYGTLNSEYVGRWFTEDDARPMWALNLMAYRSLADYGDDRAEHVSGWQADDAYAPIKPLEAVGARPVFLAPVIRQLIGDGVRWDRVAVVRYPRCTAMAEMEQLPEFQALHVHKNAGMQATIVAATFPRYDGTPPASVPDGQVLLEVVADRSMPEFGAEVGADLIGRFDVEGVVIGDGRSWQEARWHIVTPGLSRRLVQRASTYRDGCYTVLLEPLINVLPAELEQDRAGAGAPAP